LIIARATGMMDCSIQLDDVSLMRLRKSFETVSNNLMLSFSSADRLNFNSRGFFNPSRNLNMIDTCYKRPIFEHAQRSLFNHSQCLLWFDTSERRLGIAILIEKDRPLFIHDKIEQLKDE
jgi:hypothetical protein